MFYTTGILLIERSAKIFMKKAHLIFKVDEDCDLRALTERDAPALFHLSDKNRAHLRQWLGWVDANQTVEGEIAFIRSLEAEYDVNGRVTYGIYYKGQIAGTIGFNTIDWVNRKAEIGYWLGADFQGHGLITRSCKVLIDHAFHDLHLNKIEIRCATGNTRSCAVPQRLGFTHEGVSRQAEWLYDHFVDLNLFGMLATEWQS